MLKILHLLQRSYIFFSSRAYESSLYSQFLSSTPSFFSYSVFEFSFGYVQTASPLSASSLPIPSYLQSLISNITSLLNVKLNWENFLLWWSQFLAAIRAHLLLHILTASELVPIEFITDTDGKKSLNPKHIEWLQIDQYLLSCIFATISESILPYVIHLEQANDVWVALERKFTSVSRLNILQLKNQLQCIKKSSLTMHDYLKNIKSISDTLATVVTPVDDEDLILFTLGGLPAKYNPFKMAVSTRDQSITMAELQELLCIEE